MSFFRLEGGDGLPKHLRNGMPEVLGIPPGALRPQAGETEPADLRGLPIDGTADRSVRLASASDGESGRLFFDLTATIDWILLEQYHCGLEPTAEMRLPFNYSVLPPWVKGLARSLRSRSLLREPEVRFPSGDPALVVDWLRELGEWAGVEPAVRLRPIRWPNGFQAAVVISHDVDTDWLFRNPSWLDRIVNVEAEWGLKGAWYCVPMYSQSRAAAAGIERLLDWGCEVGCHGYNHDAKWPLKTGAEFARRLEAVRSFRDRWKMRGFRSEWLWRTPAFLTTLAGLFEYDSSIPTVSARFTSHSRNGCGTCYPFETYGGLIELPLTLPMDEERHLAGLGLDEFWGRQVERAHTIIAHGGIVMLSLHPQPHQAANPPTLAAVAAAIREIVSIPNLWLARPHEIAEWTRSWLHGAETASKP